MSVLGNSEEELQELTQRLEETAAEYGMEIGSDKSKVLVNNIKSRPCTNIQMNGHTLEEVDQFTYLGSTQTKDGASVKEVKIRLAQPQCHDKACNTVEKQSHEFSHKDYRPTL